MSPEAGPVFLPVYPAVCAPAELSPVSPEAGPYTLVLMIAPEAGRSGDCLQSPVSPEAGLVRVGPAEPQYLNLS